MATKRRKTGIIVRDRNEEDIVKKEAMHIIKNATDKIELINLLSRNSKKSSLSINIFTFTINLSWSKFELEWHTTFGAADCRKIVALLPGSAINLARPYGANRC